MIDFSKKLGTKPKEKMINPLEIYAGRQILPTRS